MTKSLRLNARLDEASARKVAYLKRRLPGTTTEVLRRSIDHYYEAVRSEVEDPARALRAAGFIGCADGPANLSQRYKDHLTDSLSRKL